LTGASRAWPCRLSNQPSTMARFQVQLAPAARHGQ
jgi:hypothetical protein